MQLLSLGSQYVITALVLLSKEERGKVIPASELARPLKSPGTYLSQMLAKLIKPGIIASRRGLNGGVYLARDPKEISLYDIVVAIEGDEFFSSCFLGINGCGDIEPCPFHEEWSLKKESIRSWLESTSLHDLKEQATNDWVTDRIETDQPV